MTLQTRLDWAGRCWQFPSVPHAMAHAPISLQLVLVSLAAALLLGCVVEPAAGDSAGDYDLPGPGLAYGGIPYGSVSGRVAEYYRRGGAVYNYKDGVNRKYKNNYYDFFSQDFD